MGLLLGELFCHSMSTNGWWRSPLKSSIGLLLHRQIEGVIEQTALEHVATGFAQADVKEWIKLLKVDMFHPIRSRTKRIVTLELPHSR